MAAFSPLLWNWCLCPGPSPSRPGSAPSRPAGHRRRDACGTGTCQPGDMRGVTREAGRLLGAQHMAGMDAAFMLHVPGRLPSSLQAGKLQNLPNHSH